MAMPEWDTASVLLDCLQQQFDGSLPDLPVPQNFCIVPGTEIAEDVDPIAGTDLCCDGLGWVRIGDPYPSSNFPEPDAVTTKCFPVAWAQPYEVGILGCYPSGQLAALTCAQKNQLAVEDAARIQALKKAACCYGDTVRQRGRLWTIQSIGVQGPRGNCISRVMSIVIQLPKCC